MALTWTRREWKAYSRVAWTWRSASFSRIDRAIGLYDDGANPTNRLERLLAILEAIAVWREWKQRKKHDVARDSTGRVAGLNSLVFAVKTETAVAGDAQFSVREGLADALIADVVREAGTIMDGFRASWGAPMVPRSM